MRRQGAFGDIYPPNPWFELEGEGGREEREALGLLVDGLGARGAAVPARNAFRWAGLLGKAISAIQRSIFYD